MTETTTESQRGIVVYSILDCSISGVKLLSTIDIPPSARGA